MIDCHVHTKRSHHGKGDLEDFVVVALDLGLTVIGFSEHGPFTYDSEHRMTVEETHTYLTDIQKLKTKYGKYIKILGGLEVDYMPSAVDFLQSVLPQFECDFLAGGVHFIELGDEILDVWNYEALQDKSVWKKYMQTIEQAAESGFFNNIVHPDTILRAGIGINVVKPYFEKLIHTLNRYQVGYEINCSGLSKPSYNPQIKKMVEYGSSYPSLDLAQYAYTLGVPITIGSDAHSTDELAKNIAVTLDELRKRRIQHLSYFENGVVKKFPI